MGELPQKLKFGMAPQGHGFSHEDDVKVTCIEHPAADFRRQVYRKVMATWGDAPAVWSERDMAGPLGARVDSTFMRVLKGEVLPNSMEAIQFSFLIENLPMTEVTHLLRHRAFFGIHAQCTGDRDLRHDNFFLPNSLNRGRLEFFERYQRLLRDAQLLYADMVDSKEVSLMDARYCLPRASVYYYYVSANLKDLIAFVRQRRCTMIQPKVDNVLAAGVYDVLTSHIPELKQVLKLECDQSCAWLNSPDEFNTRLYEPDENHKALLKARGKQAPESMYHKTREEMNIQ